MIRRRDSHQPPISEERLAEILRRIAERRRRAQLRAGIVAAVVVAVVAGVGLPQLLSESGAGGKQSLGLSSSRTPGAPSSASVTPPSSPSARFGTRIPRGSGPLVLETAYAGQAVIVRLGSSDPPYRVASNTPLAGPVTNPAGGWIVVSAPSYRALSRGQPERLATVDANGRVQPFGPVTPRGEGITGVAVSPNATQVAVSYAHVTSTSAAAAHLTVLPTPGHSGGERTWTLHPADITSVISSLSWAPDGRHITYIADSTTGGGFEETPLTMDTQAAGTTIPAPANSDACDQDEAVGWLGSTGRFAAVVNSCHGPHLRLVVSHGPGQPALKPALPIGHNSDQAEDLSATSDGTQILVNCDGTTLYLIKSQHVRALPRPPGNPSVDAAFAGGSR